MSRIELRLKLELVAPLLDFIKPVLDLLETEAALALPVIDDDDELEDIWRDGLINTQIEDRGFLMDLFGAPFLETGHLNVDLDDADRILRAASAIRLKVREKFLGDLSDAALEGGEFDYASLKESERKGFEVYLFFASFQEIIIRHLDG